MTDVGCSAADAATKREALGRREQKRILTRRAIQRAALQLSYEHGFDNVTIDDISAAADISPRTFFNYFATKDAALIGDLPVAPPEDAVEAFVSGTGDVFLDLGRMVVADADVQGEELELYRLRRDVFGKHPQLLGGRMASMKTWERILYDIVLRRLEAEATRDDASGGPGHAADLDDPPGGRGRRDDRSGGPGHPADLDDRAWLLTFVAIATVRHAWRAWAEDSGSGTLAERVRASFESVYSLGEGSR